MFLPFNENMLVGISKSNRKNKKYMADIQNIYTGELNTMHFGSSLHQQFKDSTGLGLYSHLDHHDKKRRYSYIKRHTPNILPYHFSPDYFSLRYLWSA